MEPVDLDASLCLFVSLCVPRVMVPESMSGVQTVLTEVSDSERFVASIACSHQMLLVVQSPVNGGLNGMIEQIRTKNRRGDRGVKHGVMISMWAKCGERRHLRAPFHPDLNLHSHSSSSIFKIQELQPGPGIEPLEGVLRAQLCHFIFSGQSSNQT